MVHAKEGEEKVEPHVKIQKESENRNQARVRKVTQHRKQLDSEYRHSQPDIQLINRPNMDKQLYVHLISHTHDDVGWIKSIDQYYSGTNQESQHATVHTILDTTIEELIKDPKRKFTYVEMKFFTMWYERQTPELRKQVRKLVKEKRLEFANGGWSATDEACPNYEDLINNMVVGH
jgi:hypothetical protein